MYLSELKIGDSAVICRLDTDTNIRRRLQEIGFIKGATVKSIMRSPLGDPTAYEVCGAVIALRNKDADTISVKVCDA